MVGIVAALSAAECLQLGGRVFRVLSRKPRELRRYTRPGRAMTAGAGGDTASSDPTTINGLALFDELRIARGAGLRFLAFEVRGHVAHIVRGQARCHSRHDRVLALRRLAVLRLEVRELLRRVLRMLSRELWVRRRRAVAVGSVAGAANFGGYSLALGGIGCCRRTLNSICGKNEGA